MFDLRVQELLRFVIQKMYNPTLVKMMKLTPHEIARDVHAHPTLSEVLMEAAHGAEGQAIHI